MFESIADRRILAARAEGLFDHLPGAGKPIPDLHRRRPDGWWATGLVKRERSKIRAEDLDKALRVAMPALWRLNAEPEMVARLDELNEMIIEHNRLSTLEPRPLLETKACVRQWRRFRSDP